MSGPDDTPAEGDPRRDQPASDVVDWLEVMRQQLAVARSAIDAADEAARRAAGVLSGPPGT